MILSSWTRLSAADIGDNDTNNVKILIWFTKYILTQNAIRRSSKYNPLQFKVSAIHQLQILWW